MAKQKQRTPQKSTKTSAAAAPARSTAPKNVRTATASRTPNKASTRTANRVAQAANSWQSNDILKYASGRDRNADYNNLLTSQNKMGAFDGAAWGRAQAAGYSDQQIRDALEGFRGSKDYGNSSLMIGVRPMAVLDNWQNDNPESYRAYTQGPNAQFSTPGRVMFNPAGESNIGLGRGGLQDRGVTWYSTQGNQDNDLSNSPYTPDVARNILENGYYAQTPQGVDRIMQGESAVPTRWTNNGQDPTKKLGSQGYDQFTSPWMSAFNTNMGYKGSWLNV
jgi:hypothetical protein